jgi:hypothetical protein
VTPADRDEAMRLGRCAERDELYKAIEDEWREADRNYELQKIGSCERDAALFVVLGLERALRIISRRNMAEAMQVVEEAQAARRAGRPLP